MKGRPDRKTGSLLLGILLVFLIIAGDIITGAVSSRAPVTTPVHDTTQLGTWLAMPPSTSCDLVSINNVTSPLCELLGNSTQRGIVIAKGTTAMIGYSAILSVHCIIVSNTIGASLSLQYSITDGNVNLTNFQTLSSVAIDGVNGCGNGIFATSASTSLNATLSNQGYLFRVVGTDGGGNGDNPRFASVNVILTNSLVRNFLPIVVSVINTQMGVAVYTSIRTSASQSVTWRWIATNASSTTPGCGSGDVCIQKGTASCTIPVNAMNCNTVTTTFTTAFTGTTQAVASDATPGQAIQVIVGIDSLLQAQTLTV